MTVLERQVSRLMEYCHSRCPGGLLVATSICVIPFAIY